MTCPTCRNFGLVTVTRDPDVDEPCHCAAGDQWLTPGELALKRLFDAFNAERTTT